MNYYVFDIDGTLADGTHRLHHILKEPKDWDTYFSLCHLDAPIPHMVLLCQHLSSWAGITFVSGRSDVVRQETREWLYQQRLYGPLYMRPAGDHRYDDVIKSELLDKVIAENGGQLPSLVFDDRNRVVKMWRARGIPCAQVAEGDF